MYSLSDELMWIHTDCEDFEPSVDITLDNDEAARLGVNKTLLSLSLAGTFNGQTVTNLWEGSTKIPVNLYSKGITGNMDYEDIGNQMVGTSIPGISVPLRQVASISPGWAPRQLDRNSGSQSVSVYADMRYERSQPVAMRKIRKYIEKEIRPKLPKGTEVVYGGLTSLNKYEAPYIAWSFLAAVSILFLFMLFHFKKFSIAFLTLITSTLCLFGASFGLWIFGLDFSLTAVLGLISLVGIIVRNGILMFEYAEDLRCKQGVDVKEASMEAGKRRMRPIFLTSCTTALGVLPMVIRGDLLWKPMGVVICFGTMLSIFLIVLIMPVAYWQLFKNAPKLTVGNEE
jgi:multidrug efflux pump subunit AcrB